MLHMLQNDIHLKNLIESWSDNLTIEDLKLPIIEIITTYEINHSHVYFIHSILSDFSKRKISLRDISYFILLLNSDLTKRSNEWNTIRIRDIMYELRLLSSDDLFSILISLVNDDEKPNFYENYLLKDKDKTYVTMEDLSHEFIYKEALLKGNNLDECNSIMKNQFLKILNEDTKLNNPEGKEITELGKLSAISNINKVNDIVRSIAYKNRLELIKKNKLLSRMMDRSLEHINMVLEQFLNDVNNNPEKHEFNLTIHVSTPPLNYELDTAIYFLEALGFKKIYERNNFTFSTELTNSVSKDRINEVLSKMKNGLVEREIILGISNISIDYVD